MNEIHFLKIVIIVIYAHYVLRFEMLFLFYLIVKIAIKFQTKNFNLGRTYGKFIDCIDISEYLDLQWAAPSRGQSTNCIVFISHSNDCFNTKFDKSTSFREHSWDGANCILHMIHCIKTEIKTIEFIFNVHLISINTVDFLIGRKSQNC